MTESTKSARFVVLKFGGTSVATAVRWQSILQQASKRAAGGLLPVVVCSAVSKISDALEKLVSEAIEVNKSQPVPAWIEVKARSDSLLSCKMCCSIR